MKNKNKSPYHGLPAWKLEDVERLMKQLTDAVNTAMGKESLYGSEVVNSFCEKARDYLAFEELILRRAKLNDADGRVKRYVDEGLEKLRSEIHEENAKVFAWLFVYHGVAANLLNPNPVTKQEPEAPAQPEEATEPEETEESN